MDHLVLTIAKVDGDGEHDDDGADCSDLWSWRGDILVMRGLKGAGGCDGWGGGVLMYEGYEGTF